jgi:hypothetical protein
MNELWEMVQEFLRPAGEVQPNIHNHPPENAHEGGALEEPPQAPEPAEVPHPDAEREALLTHLNTHIRELVRSHCERKPWKRRLSVYFPEMIKVYSDVTNDILSSGLEISTMDTESLRECVEEVHKNPNYLKSLIRGRLPD